jgi:hypothetical protein
VRLVAAKEVLAAPEKYSRAEKIDASRALYKHAQKKKDPDLMLAALKLKPHDSFEVDGEPALRLQRLLLLKEQGEVCVEDGPVVVPPVVAKPVYRPDGQVHNFAAQPYPGRRNKLDTLAAYQVRTNNARRGR